MTRKLTSDWTFPVKRPGEASDIADAARRRIARFEEIAAEAEAGEFSRETMRSVASLGLVSSGHRIRSMAAAWDKLDELAADPGSNVAEAFAALWGDQAG